MPCGGCKRPLYFNIVHIILFMVHIICFIMQIIFGITITKTYLYNFDPLKPHFYIVKLGFTGVYIIILISAQNIDCGYSLEPPRRGGSNEYHNLCFVQKYEKYLSFLSENFQFLEIKFSIHLNRRVFVMLSPFWLL